MSSKKVTWANHQGGYLEHKLNISPIGRSRSVHTRKPQKSISTNMSKLIIDKHVEMLKHVRQQIEKCQRDLLLLQEHCMWLMKEEDIISRKIKWNIMNNNSKKIIIRMHKIDKNLEEKREKIKEKKIHLGQLSNKMKATEKSTKL